MATAKRKMSSDRPNAYQIRKTTVDVAAATSIFDRSFADDAFLCGHTAGQGKARPTKLTDEIIGRIDIAGCDTLARYCLAYLLAHENAYERPNNTAYLSCLREIRDGAEKIARAADELADQILRHKTETGELESVRALTLCRLAGALHGRFRADIGDDRFNELIAHRLIDNRLSDLSMTHGLADCAALYNEAEAILEHGIGSPGMRTGNKVDRELRSFVSDLASLYEQILGKPPTAHATGAGGLSPFLRFMHRVFGGICEQKAIPIDKHAYRPPSTGTVTAILKAQ